MAPQPPDEVEALAAQHLAQLQAGQHPDRQALVRAHPELGSRLDHQLAVVEMMHQAGLSPRGGLSSLAPTEPPATIPPDLSTDQLPTLTAGDCPPSAPGRPDGLADYEILSELGRGGMGVVYQARQKSLNRLVALKMLRAGSDAGPETLARFRIEAEALASLQHPHIVHVHEVGTHDGCPFLALEYLDGGTLRDYLGGRPQPPPAAAALVETLARAMHVAHQRGIIHRDLKPANILLQKDEGSRMKDEPRQDPFSDASFILHPSAFVPKITDFGLAKRLAEGSPHSVTGSIVGTPSYMAPEQAEGRANQIGPPTDVYALGIILYEVLTGRLPFRGPSGLDTIKLVLSEEPLAPSRLCPRVPRDLETICLKCLAKEPGRRYATAQELADDLRRFRDGIPISARPVGPAERAWKWVRRRPALAALLSVCVLAALALTVVGITWSVQVRAERDRADHSLKVARQAIDDLYVKMASDRLFDEPQLEPLCQELLEKARTLYEELAQEDSTRPEVRRDIALAWFRLGDIYRLRDQHDPAEHAYGEAIARQQELCRTHPDEPGYRQDLANSHNWLGELLREGNRPADEARQHYEAALALQQELVRQFPTEPAYRLELARSHYNLGIVHKSANRLADAAASYDRAIELLTTLSQGRPVSPHVRQDLARALINRGALQRRARPREAARDCDRAIELLTGLHAEFPSRAAYKLELALAREHRGNIYWSAGGATDAQREYRAASALLEGLVADFSSRPRYKKKLGGALNNLGAALARAGDRPGAEQCWKRARTLFEKLAADYPRTADYHYLFAAMLGNLGWLRTEQKDWPAARRLIEKGIGELRAALAPNPQHPDYREELRNQYQDLAETLVQLGDHRAAALAAAKLAGVFPERAQDSYYAACFVARCVPLAGKDEEARAAYIERALKLLQRAVATAPPDLKRLPDEAQVFRPLAARPDFAPLLRALAKKPQRGSG
jgi:tetratricopeptide (TPR) repeat protein